jgi:hypothetical protein
MRIKTQSEPIVWTPATMGRKGGSAKVSKGLGKLSKKRRREIAQLSVEARRRKQDERGRTSVKHEGSGERITSQSANARRLEVA